MGEFENLTSLDKVDTFIQSSELSFIYISKNNCSVCHGLLPQVQNLMKKYPNITLGHVNVDTVGEIAGRFNIFTVPVLLLFVNGKEYIREARIVHMDLLEQKIDKIYKNVVGP
ncbi:thioredoxin family protein [Oceanobacillus sp. Castelsardo]|uniref:thioredoxin family protein n=1 Tax=Oceanobacillus sp. Castelsardo TaxID=1851204 RepID=UPI0008389AD1|nr:thioredoxin family protein [Oceanobacillus sp. Castelsardo]